MPAYTLETYGILTVLTSKSAKVSDLSPHIMFAVNKHRICDLTAAMVDKNLTVFIRV